MPSSTFNNQDTWSYEEVAGLPLPGPALVIDVRHFENQLDFDPMALLVYLWTETNDIAGEMRQHGMKRWGNLNQFLGFRKVNAGDANDYHVYDPGTWEPGEGAHAYSAIQLGALLGELVDTLRNRRIHQAGANDPEHATVRVIFLTDLADQEPDKPEQANQIAGLTGEPDHVPSFSLAVGCASLLKAWSIQQAVPRSNYGLMLETIALCFNTQSKHFNLLTEARAAQALDMLIIAEPYRMDLGRMDQQAQLSHAELILSALLLHWPEVMSTNSEDQPHVRTIPHTLPRPVYILGAAGREHATRWGERWWDYGLEAALLEKFLAREQVERQDALLQKEVEQWWQSWRSKVRWTFWELKERLPELGSVRYLDQLCQPAHFQVDSLSELRQRVQSLFQQIKPLYSDVLRRMPVQIRLLAELPKQPDRPAGVPDWHWNSYLNELHRPALEAQIFLLDLFKYGRGSVPRALRQLQLLEEYMDRLRFDIKNCDLQVCLDEWQSWYEQVEQRLVALEQDEPRRTREERRLVEKERETLVRNAWALQQKHRALIYAMLEASYALALLEKAGFTRRYNKRLKELLAFLEHLYKRSRYLRDVAGWRLALGTQKPLGPLSWQQEAPTTLLNRQDDLDHKVLMSHFEHALDELSRDKEPLLVQLLAQTSLRFLGVEESATNGTNGHMPDSRRFLNQELAQEHFQFLEILLVGSFLASRAGARLTKMEVLLANYRLALQLLQPEPDRLSLAIQEMEETIRFVSLQKKIYGEEQPPNLPWRIPDELPLAALMAGQVRDPELWAALRHTNLLRFLDDSRDKAADIVQSLDKQAVLAGFPDIVSGDETCYLYLPPGWESESFVHELHRQTQPAPTIVYTPNLEKMIYLRIHRIHQFPGDELPTAIN